MNLVGLGFCELLQLFFEFNFMIDFEIFIVGESRKYEQYLVNIISKFENKCFFIL